MTSNGTDLEDATRLKRRELETLERERRSAGTSTGGLNELPSGTSETANESTPSASPTSEEESNDNAAGTSPLAGNANSNTTTTPIQPAMRDTLISKPY